MCLKFWERIGKASIAHAHACHRCWHEQGAGRALLSTVPYGTTHANLLLALLGCTVRLSEDEHQMPYTVCDSQQTVPPNAPSSDR